MRATIRAKLVAIVGIAAFAFVLLIATGLVITRRVDRQLDAIQRRYLPLVDLESQLDAQFERLQRGFQDAVAIHDLDDLQATKNLRDQFVADLEKARGALELTEARALLSALDEYCTAASNVAKRLIGGETGEAIVDAVTEMQAQQAKVSALIRKTAALGRHDLASAFAEAVAAEKIGMSYELAISAVCLVLVLTLSLGLSRGVLRAMTSLSDGFGRFGRRDFDHTIVVRSRDELRDVADGANAMAASLRRLEEQREVAEHSLRAANRELEAFSYSVAHDLRAPLRGINGFSRAVLEDYGGKLDGDARDSLQRIAAAAERMGLLIDALLGLSRVTRAELRREPVDLTRIAEAIVKHLRLTYPERQVEFESQPGLFADGDPVLLRALLENLLGNAWKFTSARPLSHISFGVERGEDGPAYYVKDDGAGFDMAYAAKLFTPFQRLHAADEFAGTGIGLATVQRIVQRHGGRIWADGAVGRGATFRFTLPYRSKEPAG